MPFGPFLPGGVFLGGTQFSTDPEPYEPLNWPKRHSVHPTIGGGVVIQDFGVIAKDNTLRLGSGANRPISEEVVKALHALYRVKGGVHTLTDWLGNEFTVFIKSFNVVPFKRGADKAGQQVISLYTYTMELQVLTMTKFLGDTYTGT